MPDNIQAATTGVETTAATVATVADVEVSSQTETETQETNLPETNEGFVPFPKKAINLLSRKDKQIGKLRAELAQLRQMQVEAAKSQPAPKEDKGPNPDDFDTYAAFLEARQDWVTEKKLAAFKDERNKTQQREAEIARKAQFINERSREIDAKSQEYAKTFQDFNKVIEDAVPFLASLPEEVRLAGLNPRIDAALAIYNLAKSGKLYDLADMSAEEALVFLAQNQNPVSQVSKAPKPLQAATGTGSSKLGDLANDANAMRKFLAKSGVR